MVAGSQQYAHQALWIVLFPGLAIILTALSLQLLGDGIRDLLDPRLQEVDVNRLEVRHLSTFFDTDEGLIRSVADVSFSIRAGKTTAIVGESGSGKSVTSLTLMRLLPRTASDAGQRPGPVRQPRRPDAGPADAARAADARASAATRWR